MGMWEKLVWTESGEEGGSLIFIRPEALLQLSA